MVFRMDTSIRRKTKIGALNWVLLLGRIGIPSAGDTLLSYQLEGKLFS